MKRLLACIRRWWYREIVDTEAGTREDESHARIRYGIPEAVKERQRAEWAKVEELAPLDEAGRP